MTCFGRSNEMKHDFIFFLFFPKVASLLLEVILSEKNVVSLFIGI